MIQGLGCNSCFSCRQAFNCVLATGVSWLGSEAQCRGGARPMLRLRCKCRCCRERNQAKQKRFAMVITAGMYVVKAHASDCRVTHFRCILSKVNQVEGDAYLMKKELKTLGEMRVQLRRRHEQVQHAGLSDVDSFLSLTGCVTFSYSDSCARLTCGRPGSS